MALYRGEVLTDAAQLGPALQAVLKEAYRVFARYTVSGPSLGVCHCDCCCSFEDEKLLLTTPLKAMPARLLAEYTNSAHGYRHEADADNLRYFLPRYFELMALNDPPAHDGLEFALKRLGAAEFRTRWPVDEADVIERWFSEILRERLKDISLCHWPRGWQPAYDLKALLTGLVLAGADIGRLLDVWDQTEGGGPAMHLAHLSLELHWEGDGFSMHSHFLNAHIEAKSLIGRWIADVAQLPKLEAALLAADDPRIAAIISNGYEFIAGTNPSQSQPG